MGSPVHFGSEGPALFASTYTNPEEFVIQTVAKNFGVDNWYARFKMTRDQAKTMIGKWAYYRNAKSFPDTIDGRRAGGKKIAADMYKETGKKISDQDAYSFLQNVHAYIGVYEKQNPGAQVTKYVKEGEKKNAGDLVAVSIRDVGAKVSALTPWYLRPSFLAGVGLFGLGAYGLAQAKNFIPRRR